nr:MobF family relaxase [Nocardioides sp. CF8]
MESDRARADDYYLEGGTALAAFTVTDGNGEVLATSELDAEAYAGWVDWIDPLTATSMGKPRMPGEEGTAKRGSPRFAEMVVNTPKSLSVAAALHPDVSDALDAAQADAVTEIRRFLALHSVTRVGPRGRQEVVPVERLQTVAVVHKTSRAGDPHRHVHFQIGTRVWAAGRWRGLDTAALFKQQGAIRALGTAVLAAHPRLADTLDRHALTLDPVTGEVAELEPFNALMSKRSAQVERNLAEIEASWDEAHPGQEPGPVVHARMTAAAWAKGRPQKRPTTLAHEDGWRDELAEAGYDPELFMQRRLPAHAPIDVDGLRIQTIASRSLDRCAAAASTWTRHTVQEQAIRIVTEHGVRATPAELRNLVTLATDLAVGDCLSVLPPGTAQPEHVAHLTSVQVIAAEMRLRDLLTARAGTAARCDGPNVTALAAERGLDSEQARAAAAIASTDQLVVVEGAAGSGKTTMLAVAIGAAATEGRATRVVTPTKKAADVVVRELGVPAESVAKLLHAHGWRWNSDGVWTRLAVGDRDPETGKTYGGPPVWARLARGERIVVDEAGMLDQDGAIALFTLAGDAAATVALVGDRAQLPAVGRGGVLDVAAALAAGSGRTVFDMDSVHRFTDPIYADLTLRLRAGDNPAHLFDRLYSRGHVRLHTNADDAHEAIAAATAAVESTRTIAATVATNDEARSLNDRIRTQRVARGEVDDTATVSGNDELPIGAGDVITTRKNDSTLGVANRQTWTVQGIGDDGTVWALDAANLRKHPRAVALPSSYVTDHVHLAYAATAYGVQGITTTSAHTLLSEALDASGVYVGMTRGRDANVLHIVADNLDEAREHFIDALQTDRADRGLQAATSLAQVAVAALAAKGPVKLVNDERTRLVEAIANADRETARWEHAAGLLATQAEIHAHEEASGRDALLMAEAHSTAVLDDAVQPLRAQAIVDGQAYLDAQIRQDAASNANRSTGRLGRRAAQRRLDTAQVGTHDAQVTVLNRWGSVPATGRWVATNRDGLEAWAARVAHQRAEAQPVVASASTDVARADEALKQTRWRHRAETEDLTQRIYGRPDAAYVRTVSGVHGAQARAERWRQYADAVRADLTRIESLPIVRAVQLIESARAQALQVEVDRTVANHRARLGVPTDRRIRPTGPDVGRSM